MNLSEVYRTYGSMVYNLALQYSQNVEDAEEIVQDVFLQVHQKKDSFKGHSELKTWIYRITINKSLDYLKAKKAQKRWTLFAAKRIDNDDIQISDSSINHPGLKLENKEALEKLFKSINQLPEKQKTVIILLKIEDLKMNEVADIMSLSYKAVESLLQRAKKNLKEIIDKTKDYEN